MNDKSKKEFFENKVKNTLSQNNLLEKDTGVVVALSGGADSTALLLCLNTLKNEYNIKVTALHINHMIRGKEADRDEMFCQNLCKNLNVDFVCERVDIPSLSKERKMSLELCARQERYRIFEEVCTRTNSKFVATAHTASDNVETVLFNIARGTSLKGLCGIVPKRPLSDDVFVIRPLIDVTRVQVEEYLLSLGQEYVTDSTNLEDEYTRNLIRHNVVPQLQKINPSLEDAVVRMSQNISLICEFVKNQADNLFCDNVKELNSLDVFMQGEIIKIMFEKKAPATSMLESVHIQGVIKEISRVANGEKSMSFVSLPEGLCAFISNGKIKILHESEVKESLEANEYYLPLSQCDNFVNHDKFLLRVCDGKENFPEKLSFNENVYKKYNSATLYCDTIPHNLYVKNKKGSDTIQLCGINKSVKRLLNEAKIPLEERNSLPVVANKDNIVYIPKVGVCDKFSKKSDENKYQITICVYIRT